MNKPPLLLLHGALGAAHQFDELAGKLAGHYEVHALDLSGHGSRANSTDPFSIDRFKEDIRTYCNMYRMGGLRIFGYSMGGYVAAAFAADDGGCVRALMTLGTKWHWDAETAAKETARLDPAKIKEKVPQFAEVLKNRHGAKNWERVLENTAQFMQELGAGKGILNGDLKKISAPTCTGLGDQDNMVTMEETLDTYRKLSNGSLWISPATPHPLEQVPTSLLAENILRWMAEA